MLHAAGILWRGHGLVVSGHAGAGKTTVARLALGYGEPVQRRGGDRRSVRAAAAATEHTVRRAHDAAGVGAARQSAAPATALLLLAHAPDFELTPMEPGRGGDGAAAHQHCGRGATGPERVTVS
jgi:hypothetical protein